VPAVLAGSAPQRMEQMRRWDIGEWFGAKTRTMIMSHPTTMSACSCSLPS